MNTKSEGVVMSYWSRVSIKVFYRREMWWQTAGSKPEKAKIHPLDISNRKDWMFSFSLKALIGAKLFGLWISQLYSGIAMPNWMNSFGFIWCFYLQAVPKPSKSKGPHQNIQNEKWKKHKHHLRIEIMGIPTKWDPLLCAEAPQRGQWRLTTSKIAGDWAPAGTGSSKKCGVDYFQKGSFSTLVVLGKLKCPSCPRKVWRFRRKNRGPCSTGLLVIVQYHANSCR